MSRWSFHSGSDQYGEYVEFNVGRALARMRLVKPGRFMMGSPDSEPGRMAHEVLHPVTITKPFFLSDTACTQLLWQEVMGSNPSWSKAENKPVEQLSWNDTQEFARTINRGLDGWRFRLPTEAEWEYACRAGTQTPFSFGENITTDQVNYNGNFPYPGGEKGIYRDETVEVRSLPPNAWGFFEMHGNAWEWIQDIYQEDLGTAPAVDPQGAPEGEFKVMRGACWVDPAETTRSADRDIGKTMLRFPFLSVRFAADPVPFNGG